MKTIGILDIEIEYHTRCDIGTMNKGLWGMMIGLKRVYKYNLILQDPIRSLNLESQNQYSNIRINLLSELSMVFHSKYTTSSADISYA